MARQSILDDDFSSFAISTNYNFSFLNLLSAAEDPITALNTEPSTSVVALAAISLCLGSCGGDSQPTQNSVPIPVTQPTTAVSYASTPKYAFQTITSNTVSIKNILIAGEALTVADINGDGKKDIILSNAGDGSIQGPQGTLAGSLMLKASDNKTTIFMNNGDNTFSLLNTDNTRSTGWVNDWVILPNPNGGNPYIVGIDHGREYGGLSNFSEWKSKLPVFQFQDGRLVDLTDTVSTTSLYYHNSSNYGDLNNDGVMDFVTANLNKFSIFYGDKQTIFKDVTNVALGNQNPYNSYGDKSFIGSTGAALIIDIGGDKQNDIVLLPYVKTNSNIDYYNADVVKYNDGSPSEKYTFSVRTDTKIPDHFGFHTAKVVDINKDGLDDIIAMMESNQGSNNRIISVMLQNKTGTFDVSFVNENNSIVLGPGENSSYRTDAKFELFDIDGDGNLDIYLNMFWGLTSDKASGVYFGDGSGQFSSNTSKSEKIFETVDWTNTCARTIMVDFNDDGKPDLLAFKVAHDSSGISTTITPTVFMNFG